MVYFEDLVKLVNKKTGEIKLFSSRLAAQKFVNKINSNNWMVKST